MAGVPVPIGQAGVRSAPGPPGPRRRPFSKQVLTAATALYALPEILHEPTQFPAGDRWNQSRGGKDAPPDEIVAWSWEAERRAVLTELTQSCQLEPVSDHD
jgi:hypothetical protein